MSLKKNKGQGVSQSEYAKNISKVMFLMNYTRPDNVVSRLRDIHITLIKTIR